jgi:AraC-like DNA-binding protein
LSRAAEIGNRLLLRARDEIDRAYASPLDVDALARVAHVSPAHFIRTFKATFGETPHRYLQRRRVERAMYLLRTTDRSVTEICLEVGFTSIGTFGRTFRDIVGESPTGHRARGPLGNVPSCFVKAWTRPSSTIASNRRTGASNRRTGASNRTVATNRAVGSSSFGEADDGWPSVR